VAVKQQQIANTAVNFTEQQNVL